MPRWLNAFIFCDIIIFGLFSGYLFGHWALGRVPQLNLDRNHLVYQITGFHRPVILGFMPYWLLNKSDNDYSRGLTDISYFGLVIDSDGSIIKTNDQNQEDPGWNKLKSSAWTDFRTRSPSLNYSLVLQSGIEDSINTLIADPVPHAQKMMAQVMPIMKKYNFKDINIDIESLASVDPKAQDNFTRFIKTIRQEMIAKHLGRLSIDIPVSAFTKTTIYDSEKLEPLVDYAILMAYDYHYRSSMIAGPVAPTDGTPQVREIDVRSAVTAAIKSFKPSQLLLGIPLYGYEWETISDTFEAPIIPGSGQVASRFRIDSLLSQCRNCHLTLDPVSDEKTLLFKDDIFGSFHQIYYGDTESLSHKIQLAKDLKLGGIAFWALGYENQKLLPALNSYKNYFWWQY